MRVDIKLSNDGVGVDCGQNEDADDADLEPVAHGDGQLGLAAALSHQHEDRDHNDEDHHPSPSKQS